MLFRICIYLLLHLVKVVGDENASPLASCLGLGDENDGRLLFGFGLGYLARCQLVLSFGQSFCVVLRNLVQVLRVQPRLWEEPVMVRKLFLESLQVN